MSGISAERHWIRKENKIGHDVNIIFCKNGINAMMIRKENISYIFDAFPIANNNPGKHFVTILSVLHPRFLVHVSEHDLVIFSNLLTQCQYLYFKYCTNWDISKIALQIKKTLLHKIMKACFSDHCYIEKYGFLETRWWPHFEMFTNEIAHENLWCIIHTEYFLWLVVVVQC